MICRAAGIPTHAFGETRNLTVIGDSMANPDEIPRRYLADIALARLMAGNRRFVHGKARFPTVR